MQNKPIIIIVGGGAGGLELASNLSKLYKKYALAEVILVSKNLTHLWKPLLHEIAAGTLDANIDQVSYFMHAQQYCATPGKLKSFPRLPTASTKIS